jgi:hypothetical protein
MGYRFYSEENLKYLGLAETKSRKISTRRLDISSNNLKAQKR